MADAGPPASTDKERQTIALQHLASKERETNLAAGSKKRKKAVRTSFRAISEEALHQDISASTGTERQTVALAQQESKGGDVRRPTRNQKRKMSAAEDALTYSRSVPEEALHQGRGRQSEVAINLCQAAGLQ